MGVVVQKAEQVACFGCLHQSAPICTNLYQTDLVLAGQNGSPENNMEQTFIFTLAVVC